MCKQLSKELLLLLIKLENELNKTKLKNKNN